MPKDEAEKNLHDCQALAKAMFDQFAGANVHREAIAIIGALVVAMSFEADEEMRTDREKVDRALNSLDAMIRRYVFE